MNLSMNLLITGAKGFIGKNLVAELRNRGYHRIFEYDVDTPSEHLDTYVKECQFVFHLAGVNRPPKTEDFMTGNAGFTSQLLHGLKKHHNKAPVLITSSTQATLDNAYGKSKKAGEDSLFDYAKETRATVYVYRLTNVFGKWCRPNYNSAVATFCHNIAHDLPVTISDPEAVVKLIYVDDVVRSLIETMESGLSSTEAYHHVSPVYEVKLGKIVALIEDFKASSHHLFVPDMGDAFTKKLYATYLSYLPENKFTYPLKMNVDHRGSFTEFLKTPDRGQVSINISKPGITKGEHWHHSKNEKFLVVSGSGVIRLRHIDSSQIVECFVSGHKLEVVHIPVGYTHNITNLGTDDMVTVMWVNEVFDPEKPDTHPLKV